MARLSWNLKIKSKLLLLLDIKRQNLIKSKKQIKKKPNMRQMLSDFTLLKKFINQKKVLLFYINFYYNKFFIDIFNRYFFNFSFIISTVYLTNIEFVFLKCYCFFIKQIQYFGLQILYKIIYTIIYIYPIHINLFKFKYLSLSSKIFISVKKKNQLLYIFILFLLFLYKKLRILKNLQNLNKRFLIHKRKFFLNLIWFRSYLTAWFLNYYPSASIL